MKKNRSLILSFFILFIVCKKEILIPYSKASISSDTSSLYHLIGQSFGAFIAQKILNQYSIFTQKELVAHSKKGSYNFAKNRALSYSKNHLSKDRVTKNINLSTTLLIIKERNL